MYRNISELLEHAANTYGNKTAFADETKSITFRELWIMSQKIASLFLEEVQVGKPIAVLMEKSVDAICILFGIVSAGGAYSFIEPEQPVKRIRSIIDTLQPAFVVASDIIADSEDAPVQKIIYSENIFNDIQSVSIKKELLTERQRKIIATQPLYINFTSGSTGIPKGVAVSQQSVLDFIPNFVEVMNITEQDVIGNQAPFDFDVSVKDIYSGIYIGASVELIPRCYFMQPQLLMDYICDRNISILIWAVSALCFITAMRGLEYRCPQMLKCVGFSGECMPVKHFNKLRQYLPRTRFFNLYGPTEITCNCTFYEIAADEVYTADETIPIGKGFQNKNVFLLDENDKRIPENDIEKIGEICVTGVGVALGYYRNQERTKESFMQNPLRDEYIEMMYRTGDLAKYNQNGDLVYVSRKDTQIKHLGHRIELGEIETAFSGVEGVFRAACIYSPEKNRIVLFYTGDCRKEELNKKAKEQLPAYMIPNKILQLEQMPINAHGKIDRNALREMV